MWIHGFHSPGKWNIGIASWRFSFTNCKLSLPHTCTHARAHPWYLREKIPAGRWKGRSGIKTTGELKEAPRDRFPHQWDAFLSFPQFSIELLHCSHEIDLIDTLVGNISPPSRAVLLSLCLIIPPFPEWVMRNVGYESTLGCVEESVMKGCEGLK